MQFGGRVVPDDADQGEGPYVPGGDALLGGTGARSRPSGARGSDWVLPGTDTSAGAAPRTEAGSAPRAEAGSAPRAAVEEADGVAEPVVVAADAGGASGRARAAAHVTPIEEARNPRMPWIVDITGQICPMVN